MTSAEVKAPLGCSRSPSSAGKEMGIGKTLRSHDFKLLPFPDERLDPNSVCSTGVHSHPSASNIQRMSSVVWQKDFSFLSLIRIFPSGCLFYAKWQSASNLSAPLLDTEEWQRCKQLGATQRTWILVTPQITLLGSEMPAFLSDHLTELTGHDGEGTRPLTRSSVSWAF